MVFTFEKLWWGFLQFFLIFVSQISQSPVYMFFWVSSNVSLHFSHPNVLRSVPPRAAHSSPGLLRFLGQLAVGSKKCAEEGSYFQLFFTFVSLMMAVASEKVWRAPRTLIYNSVLISYLGHLGSRLSDFLWLSPYSLFMFFLVRHSSFLACGLDLSLGCFESFVYWRIRMCIRCRAKSKPLSHWYEEIPRWLLSPRWVHGQPEC